jgi:hypothetical protein
LLLLDELVCWEPGFWAVAGTEYAIRRKEAARHREKSAGCRKDDLFEEDTIRFRRSHEV